MRSFSNSIVALIVLIGFGLSPSLASAQNKYAPPEVSLTKLENGLQVVVIPDRRAHVVTHMIWYKAGSADEPQGKSGIAHFLEHLMFKGTKNAKAGEFSVKIAEIGGKENAFTTLDYTTYYQKISPDALEMAMTYEADRMENLVLDDSVIEPEKKVILEERRSRIDSSPSAILGVTADAMLFKHHPYGTPIIGWKNEMLELTKDDAFAFYNKFYSPNNAILVVAGDVEINSVLELARKTYGKVERRVDDVVRKRVVEPEPVTARTVEYEDPRVTRPAFSRLYLVPSYQRAEGRDAESLEILADILGGSTTSRFYRSIVLDKELATSAGAWYQGGALDMTKLGVYGAPRGDTSIEDVAKAIDQEIDALVADGVSVEEVERSKNNLINSVIFERDSQTALARLYGTVFSLGGDLDDIHLWPDRLAKVTVEDVNNVARKFLKKSRSVSSYLRPQL